MRSPWSDVADEVTRRTPEEDERALELARVWVGFSPGYGGRCVGCNVKPHPEHGCLCGRSKSHAT